MIFSAYPIQRPATSSRVLLICLVVASLTLPGCARWRAVDTHEPVPSNRIPTSRMSPDAVAIEIALANLDHDQTGQLEAFWSQLDQQKIPFEHRKTLDSNGIRMAIVPAHVPGALRELLKPREIDPEELDSFQKQMHEKGLLKPTERLVIHEKIQNGNGEAHEVSVSPIHPEMSWLVTSSQGRSAGAGKSVRGVISIKTFPQGDGSVRFKLSPQIHHGDSRTQIGVYDKSFLFESHQSVTELAKLDTEMELLPGETLVLGATQDVNDLGQLFFGMPASKEKAQRLLLIRLVQTQWDDLFGRRNRGQKLISAPHD